MCTSIYYFEKSQLNQTNVVTTRRILTQRDREKEREATEKSEEQETRQRVQLVVLNRIFHVKYLLNNRNFEQKIVYEYATRRQAFSHRKQRPGRDFLRGNKTVNI